MCILCFTHHDPFEDTESGTYKDLLTTCLCFTHHDPFEDTESIECYCGTSPTIHVSPTTIRLRILKETSRRHGCPIHLVSPTTIRLRILKDHGVAAASGAAGVSPTTIRLRILKGIVSLYKRPRARSFTHHDPFEDTERD